MRFIEVTNVSCGPMYINADHIEAIVDTDGVTSVNVFGGESSYYLVRETKEEVLQKIYEAEGGKR